MPEVIHVKDELAEFLKLVRWSARDKADDLIVALADNLWTSTANNMALVHGEAGAQAFDRDAAVQDSPTARAGKILGWAMASGTNMEEMLHLAALEAPLLGARMIVLRDPLLAAGPRIDRANRAFRGKYMVAHGDVWDALDSDPSWSFDTGKEAGGWCVVGDDISALIRDSLSWTVPDDEPDAAF